jgi:hypothetical protein
MPNPNSVPKKKSFFSNLVDKAAGENGENIGELTNAGMDVIGNVLGAFTADDTHKGQATGQAVGGGIGAVAGSFIGMPGVGAKVGGAIGGLIGGQTDAKRELKLTEDAGHKKNYTLDLMENVDPYGQFKKGGIVGYYEDGGAVDGGGDDDPNMIKRKAVMNDWNTFIDFLDTKGLKGSAKLNTDKNFNQSLFNEYRKANPKSQLTYDMVPDVQKEFVNYRNYSIDQLRNGKLKVQGKDGKILTPDQFEPQLGKNFENFWPELSKVDGWVGEKTSKWKFPTLYMQTIDGTTGQVIKEQNKGNVTAGQFRKGGFAGMIDCYEEGGATMASPVQEEQPQTKTINIERNELLSDTDGNIISDYENPNRYGPHADNQYLEPAGNFVTVNSDSVVIPKNKRRAFKEGDALTRRSIIRQLVDNQVKDPHINDAPTGKKMEEGGYTGDEDVPPYLRRPASQPVPELAYSQNIPNNRTLGPVDPRTSRIQEMVMGEEPSAVVNNIKPVSVVNNNPPADASVKEGGVKSKLNGKMLGRTVLGALPGIVQGVKSLQGDPSLAPVHNAGFDDAKSYIGQMPDYINVDDQIAAIDQDAAAALKAISGANTPSARAEAQNIMAKASQMKGQVISEAKRTGVQMRSNKLQALAGLETNQGASDQQEDIRYQTERRMNEANADDIQANVLHDAYGMYAGAHNDAEKIAAINAATKFVDINPWELQRYTEDPEARDYIFSYISRGGKLTDAIATYNEQKGTTTVEKNTVNRDRVGNLKGTSTENTTIKRNK